MHEKNEQLLHFEWRFDGYMPYETTKLVEVGSTLILPQTALDSFRGVTITRGKLQEDPSQDEG